MLLYSGGFNPSEKICSSNWIISPSRNEHKKNMWNQQLGYDRKFLHTLVVYGQSTRRPPNLQKSISPPYPSVSHPPNRLQWYHRWSFPPKKRLPNIWNCWLFFHKPWSSGATGNTTLKHLRVYQVHPFHAILLSCRMMKKDSLKKNPIRSYNHNFYILNNHNALHHPKKLLFSCCVFLHCLNFIDSLITSKLHAKLPPFRGTKGSTVVGFFSSGKAKPIGFSSQFLGGLLSKLDEWTLEPNK